VSDLGKLHNGYFVSGRAKAKIIMGGGPLIIFYLDSFPSGRPPVLSGSDSKKSLLLATSPTIIFHQAIFISPRIRH